MGGATAFDSRVESRKDLIFVNTFAGVGTFPPWVRSFISYTAFLMFESVVRSLFLRSRLVFQEWSLLALR